MKNNKLTDITIRFSSNTSKLRNNTIALTNASFAGCNLTLHANNTFNNNTAGGIAKDDATAELSSTVISYTVNTKFIKLNDTKITVDPSVEAGATAILSSKNTNFY